MIVVQPAVGECASGQRGSALLDASASYDPEGAPLSFAWTGPASIAFSAPASAITGATANLGKRTATLVVGDGGSSSTSEVTVDIRDTRAPTSRLVVEGQTLANGWYYRGAHAYAVGTDACDPAPCGHLQLRGSNDLLGACGAIGLYGPGAWTSEHWARDAAGNEGARLAGADIVVVYNFGATIDVVSARTLGTRLEVDASFDGSRPVPGATVSGVIHRVTGLPSSVNGVTRFPFSGTTGPDGTLVVDAPPVATLAGGYRAVATVSALGLSRTVETYYTVGLV